MCGMISSVARAAVVGVALAVAVALVTFAATDKEQQPFLRDARVTDGSMRLLHVAPRSAGPALGPAHAAFLDARHGFVATTGGGHYAAGVGYAPTRAGAIQVTFDGG